MDHAQRKEAVTQINAQLPLTPCAEEAAAVLQQLASTSSASLADNECVREVLTAVTSASPLTTPPVALMIYITLDQAKALLRAEPVVLRNQILIYLLHIFMETVPADAVAGCLAALQVDRKTGARRMNACVVLMFNRHLPYHKAYLTIELAQPIAQQRLPCCCWMCCSSSVERLFACPQCNLARYCGRACQLRDWHERHKNLCAIAQLAAKREMK